MLWRGMGETSFSFFTLKQSNYESCSYRLSLIPSKENPLFVATDFAQRELEEELHGTEYTNEAQLYSSSLHQKFPFLSLLCTKPQVATKREKKGRSGEEGM